MRIGLLLTKGGYSSLSKDMPALSLFVHRAMGMMQELNERIVSRNVLIAAHAREGGTGAGMSGERLMHYSGMLAGEAVRAGLPDEHPAAQVENVAQAATPAIRATTTGPSLDGLEGFAPTMPTPGA